MICAAALGVSTFAHADMPLAARFTALCPMYVQGRSTADEVAHTAAIMGYTERTDDGGHTHLKGPSGEIELSQVNGRRCTFMRPTTEYGSLITEFTGWANQASSGPYTFKNEGADVDGQRGVVWTGPSFNVQITETFDDDDNLVLAVEAIKRP